MGSVTDALTNVLAQARDLEQLKNIENANATSFNYPDAVNFLIQSAEGHGINKKSLIKRLLQQSNLERAFIYHLLNGTKRMTRDKFLMFAIAGELSLEEVNCLLKYAGEAELYSRNSRDAALIFIFNNHCNLLDANLCLADLNVEILK